MEVVILADDKSIEAADNAWAKLGAVETQISEVYRAAKERDLDLILVARDRTDMHQSVAKRIRSSNALVDIWKLVASPDDLNVEPFFDGAIAEGIGLDGVRKKIKQIIAEKKLLASFGIVGRTATMRHLVRTIDRVAPTDVSVLVVGPSGSGKELVARALHDHSPRADQPFVAINCGALAEGVLESELFGHEKGAFTGSVGKRDGLFRKASGGTIFLDEIGETKPDMQVKLLRVLDDGTFYPVGSSQPLRTDARVVAATNRDLTESIAEKTFREDLYYRISAVKLVVPSLRERPADIQPLLQHFSRSHAGFDLTDSALRRLEKYDWPGNVRQLKNFVARMAALKPSGLINADDVDKFLTEQHATATHLPVATGKSVQEAGQELIYRAILSLGAEIRLLRNLITANLPSSAETVSEEMYPDGAGAGGTMEEMEKGLIRQVLQEAGGNRKETARRLGIGERTLYRKLNRYNLS